MRTLLLLLSALLFPLTVYGFGNGVEGCSGDCTACHKVTLSEVREIFAKLDPGASVEEVTPAPARGLYQVTVKKESQLQVAYLDFSKNFLLAGQLIDLKNRRDLTREAISDRITVPAAEIPLRRALVMGNPQGKKVVYLFSDPECPYCAELHRTVSELAREEPELKVYILLIPLDIHPDSLWKTESILCKAEKDMPGALDLLERSYQKREIPKPACAQGSASEMKRLGEKLGIGVTPTIAFGNGKALRGARSKEEIRRLLGS